MAVCKVLALQIQGAEFHPQNPWERRQYKALPMTSQDLGEIVLTQWSHR